jgi:CubicO group peptidase (beta-lactamase class C family)
MKYFLSAIHRKCLFFLFSIIVFLPLLHAQSQVEKLDQLLGLYHDYDEFNGSVLVAMDGEVIYKKGFGLANMEWQIPNAPDTRHRLGSVTKQFTAMLILQLAAEGKLDLQANVSTYLPDYPEENGKRITIHHLLTHTSGIPNYTDLAEIMQSESRNPFSPDEFTEKFSDLELEFTPGETFKYSNSGYFLLGVIVEKITGKTYEAVLQERIFDALDMHDSGYDRHQTVLPQRASGYEKSGRNYINAAYLDMSIPYAAGSLYSTVEDLYRWDRALYTHDLLPEKYMKLYFQPHVPAFGSAHYAYGWIINEDPIGISDQKISAISHGGGINGFNTIISRAPSDQSLIVLLNNTGMAPLNDMVTAIRGILYDQPYDLPKKSLVPALLDVIEAQGLEKGLLHYESLVDDKDYVVNEAEMNQAGYGFMRDGKLDEAAAIFKLNMEAFPESYNVYDSYAEALMNMGEKEKAIKFYRKSVEMNPGNQNGIDMLQKLGVEPGEVVKKVEVPMETLDQYVGRYELQPGFVLRIFREEGRLKGQATGQGAFDLFAKSQTVFYARVAPIQITFNTGEQNKVNSLTLEQGDYTIEGKRLED